MSAPRHRAKQARPHLTPPAFAARSETGESGHGATLRLSVILGIAIVLLTGSWGTYAYWMTEVPANADAKISGGQASLSSVKTRILLYSKQTPTQGRRYTSTSTCPSIAGYADCRDVTATLASERLVVGDQLRIVRAATLSGVGDNLTGSFEVDATGLLDQSSCPTPANPAATNGFMCAATVDLKVDTPDGSNPFSTSLTSNHPVDASTGTGIGNYTITWRMRVPESDGAANWNERLINQAVKLGPLRVGFTQGM